MIISLALCLGPGLLLFWLATKRKRKALAISLPGVNDESKTTYEAMATELETMTARAESLQKYIDVNFNRALYSRWENGRLVDLDAWHNAVSERKSLNVKMLGIKAKMRNIKGSAVENYWSEL